ncbi:MAG: glycosyltransferase [Bryobacteraceae bacterium]
MIDVEHFRRIEVDRTESEERVLLYVGRISSEKNLRRLVNAFTRVQREGHDQRLKLWIAGYGPMRVELEHLVVGLGLAGCVKFLGPVPQERLPEVYSQADLFILPSTSETWGLVVNEAMCCELPVLVSSRCGCAESLVNKETGWVVDPFDEQAMAEAISQAARLPRERLLAMGRAGRQLCEQHSPAKCAARVVDGLSQVLSS